MASFEESEEAPSLVNLDLLEKKTIPVTILTGFLGSGKTTLLNYLLTQPHGKRIAIIENEFSAGLGIENMIAKSGLNGDSISGFFELNNGCICCSVKEDLLLTLEQLVLHADRFDYILIETTGVANPGPIISSLWTDDDLDTSLRLDAVVTVVDTPNIASYLRNPDTATDVTHQIAYADRILLNKIDLVPEKTVHAAERAVRGINPSAKLVPTSFSTIDPDWIFNSNSYSTATLPEIAASLASPPVTDHVHDEQCSSQCSASHSAQTLTSCGINFSGDCDLHKLNILLDRILYSHTNPITHTATADTHAADASNIIYRMKGILHIHNHEYLHIMQAVHDVFDIQPSSYTRGSEGDSTGGVNKVIVIGKNIDAAHLETELLACLAAN